MSRLTGRPWVRTFLSYAIWLVPCWIISIFVCARVIFGLDTPATLTEEWVRSIILGGSAGLLGATLETWVLPRVTLRVPFTVALVLRTILYAIVIIFLVILGIIRVTLVGQEASDSGSTIEVAEILQILGGNESIAVSLLLLVTSFLISLAFQVNRVLGPGTLVALLLGRYVRPAHEERIFLFLDLTDSTQIAEKLGPLLFSDFKNDFFHDVSRPVIATRGEIFQYVGDEVVISWLYDRGISNSNCLRTFFLIEDAINARRDSYLRHYGIAPEFKAGCHGGSVVTAEIGDLKRAIVHSGDPLNTTARIEGQCRTLGHRFLVSQQLLEDCALPHELQASEVGSVALRGKSEPVRLFAISRAKDRH